MKEGQKAIYYVTAENLQTARNSPHLEIFRDKGVEVLLLTDPIDEWLTAHLSEFDGKPLQSVMKGELDLGELESENEKEDKSEQDEGEHEKLIERIQVVLEDRVKEVRVTHRLTSSPACLVADEQGMSRHLEQILRASGQEVPASKPILEVNPGHPLVGRLEAEQDEERFSDWSHILFDQALLSEGGKLEDPADFVHRLNNLFLEMNSTSQGS